MVLVLVLTAALVLGIGTCGEREATIPTEPVATTAPVTEQSVATTTPAPMTTTTVAVQGPITLKYATTCGETEAGGKIVQRFCDYVEDATAGTVTFRIYFGGTLGSITQELDLVGSGSADMISFAHQWYPDRAPLLNFPPWALPDAETALAYFDFLAFENRQTAALIQEEAARNNVVYLGFTTGGSSVFVGKDPLVALTELTGKQCAAEGAPSGSIAALQALGLEVVESTLPDILGGLSGGVADCAWAGFAAAVQRRWYEVTPHYLFDGVYTAGNAFTVNLETWTLLTPATQAVMYEAAKDAKEYSLRLAAVDRESGLAVLTDAGATVSTLSPEDMAAWWDILFRSGAADCMARAGDLEIVDHMTTILAAAAEFTGMAWPAE